MHSNRPASRRIPDWQIGCIDSKWKWIVPWGVFGLVGVAFASLCSTPWICEAIERNTFYEFRLRLADHSAAAMPGATVVQIQSDRQIQLGEVTLDFSPPEVRTAHPWELYELQWKQALQRRHDVRAAVQREIKKIPRTPTIVLRVNPQVQLETIAIVWTSVEAVSKATLYLDVTGTEQRGGD